MYTEAFEQEEVEFLSTIARDIRDRQQIKSLPKNILANWSFTQNKQKEPSL